MSKQTIKQFVLNKFTEYQVLAIKDIKPQRRQDKSATITAGKHHFR